MQNKKNLNLNIEEENTYLKKVMFIIVVIVIGYVLYYIVSAMEERKEKERIIKEQVIEYNRQVIEQQKIKNEEILREVNQQKIINKKEYFTEDYKNFKIDYEIVSGKNDINFINNINKITRDIYNIKSKRNDNNYQIEIVGYISEYGNLFFYISKRKPSNDYDNQFNERLNELRKIKFNVQEDTVNFKIYVDNNSNDLN